MSEAPSGEGRGWACGPAGSLSRLQAACGRPPDAAVNPSSASQANLVLDIESVRDPADRPRVALRRRRQPLAAFGLPPCRSGLAKGHAISAKQGRACVSAGGPPRLLPACLSVFAIDAAGVRSSGPQGCLCLSLLPVVMPEEAPLVPDAVQCRRLCLALCQRSCLGEVCLASRRADGGVPPCLRQSCQRVGCAWG